jgi:membrane protein YdbS with pleckstrin-like domain
MTSTVAVYLLGTVASSLIVYAMSELSLPASVVVAVLIQLAIIPIRWAFSQRKVAP